MLKYFKSFSKKFNKKSKLEKFQLLIFEVFFKTFKYPL